MTTGIFIELTETEKEAIAKASPYFESIKSITATQLSNYAKTVLMSSIDLANAVDEGLNDAGVEDAELAIEPAETEQASDQVTEQATLTPEQATAKASSRFSHLIKKAGDLS